MTEQTTSGIMARTIISILLIAVFASPVKGQIEMFHSLNWTSAAPPTNIYPTTNRVGIWEYTSNITSSSNNVSSWGAFEGSGNFVQATGANQPNIGGTGITFNGSTDYLSLAGNRAQPANIYIVVQFLSGTTQAIWGWGNMFHMRDLFGGGTNDAYLFDNSFNGGTNPTSLSNTTTYLISITVNGASSTISINSAGATTVSVSGSTLTGPFWIGAADLTALFGSIFYGNILVKAVGIYGSQSAGDITTTKNTFLARFP